MVSHYLFLTASSRASGLLGNTGWLAQLTAVAPYAAFLNMPFAGRLWGKGGPPAVVQANAQAVAQAGRFFTAQAGTACARG